MSFSLHHYVKSLEEFQTQTDRLVTVFEGMHAPVKKEKIMGYREELQNNQFQITVVGEFGRGKSMFINALLGEKILPSSPKTTTTVLNHISYGEETEVILHFQDETKKVIGQEEFQRIVAPIEPLPGDDQGQREYDKAVAYIESIAYADICYPIDFCKDGVRIIDTPGLNDGNATRDRLASEIIPRSDVAILLLTAKSPLSKSEMTMLKDRLLENDIQKVFLVANFKDALRTEQDEKEVTDYIRENLQGIIDDPRIFLVSAKQGLTTRRVLNGEELRVRKPVTLEETGIPEFEHALAEFLMYDRGKVKMKRPIQQTIRLINETLDKDVKLVKRSLEMERHGLEEKINNIQNQLEDFRKSGEKSLQQIRNMLRSKEKDIIQWYKDELTKIKQAGIHAFDRSDSLDETTITNHVEAATAPLERQLHEEKVERMQNLAKKIIQLGSKELNHKWGQIDTNFNQLMTIEEDTQLQVSFHNGEQPAYDIFDDIYEELDFAWSRSTSIFGKAAIAAGYMLNTVASGIVSFLKNWFGTSDKEKRRKLRSQLSNQLSANHANKVNALKKEWKAVIKGIESNYHQTVKQMIREKEQQLATLTHNTQLEKTEIENRLAVIRQQEQALKQIHQECVHLLERLNIRSEEEVHV
ncbi:dynamin family protein [Lentibacillus sp. Marseille-P4043]|uniref:dynamin family protein n=1 Tax=Lentibacillus sp. Marseille-P4043 TaxID=2040293 RepID=UPI000D0AC04E|nr:dynamin family protein [Lentibacillus sp. Marseille-P4043]